MVGLKSYGSKHDVFMSTHGPFMQLSEITSIDCYFSLLLMDRQVIT